MTRQEIREQVAKWLCVNQSHFRWIEASIQEEKAFLQDADLLLQLLDTLGVVLKVEGELPSIPRNWNAAKYNEALRYHGVFRTERLV